LALNFFMENELRSSPSSPGCPHKLRLAVGHHRFLGTFLADPLDVPADAVAYLAEQLGIAEASWFRRYAERLPTQHEHAREIRRADGYREYAQASGELRAFLTARCWTSSDGPIALFNQATTWMVEQKVVLPGATVLGRSVSEIRAEVSERLWRTLAEAASPELRQRLTAILDTEEGSLTPRRAAVVAKPRRR
jgi:hypothetical protein